MICIDSTVISQDWGNTGTFPYGVIFHENSLLYTVVLLFRMSGQILLSHIAIFFSESSMTAELFSVSVTPSPVFFVFAILLEVSCAKKDPRKNKMCGKCPGRARPSYQQFLGRDRSW